MHEISTFYSHIDVSIKLLINRIQQLCCMENFDDIVNGNFAGFLETWRLGKDPECVFLARKTWRDQEDDGVGCQ